MRQKPPNRNPRIAHITIRLPVALLAEVDRLAVDTYTSSRAAMIRTLIRTGLTGYQETQRRVGR